MKSLFTGLLILLVLVSMPIKVRGQMGMMDNPDRNTTATGSEDQHGLPLEVVLQTILTSQQVDTIQQLDLDKITDDQWAELGDAVMEQNHPGEAHEVMDQMMGGEGSASLRQMHINMGKSYLGAGTNTGPGMMGGGMMGMMNWSNATNPSNTNYSQWSSPMMGIGGSMMGAGGITGVAGALGSITWIAVIAFLLSGTYFFIKKAGKK